jgi:hypothetical protein
MNDDDDKISLCIYKNLFSWIYFCDFSLSFSLSLSSSPWLPVRTAVFLFSFYTFSAIVVGSICFSSLSTFFAQFIVSSSMPDGIFRFNSQSTYRLLFSFMYESIKIIFIVYLITLLSDTNQNTHLEAEKNIDSTANWRLSLIILFMYQTCTKAFRIDFFLSRNLSLTMKFFK